MLAVAELLVRGGERIALIGLTPPMASRKATSRIAETLAAHEGDAAVQTSLPPPARLSRFSGALLFGDFLDPPETIAARLNEMAESGVTGHLIQVARSGRGDAALRGPHGVPRARRQRALGRRPRRDPAPANTRRGSRRTAREIERGRAPHRLVVPGASHRPAGVRAAAHAHHAHAGHGRRLPLEAAERAADGRHAMTLGALAFLSPWLLAGLLALPVI